MLKLRLQRVGRKHDPSYRVVVTEHTRGPKSRDYVEMVGSYDARKKAGKDNPQLDNERISYWLEQGVKPSGTVHNLLVDAGLVEGKKVNVLPKRKPTEDKPEEAKAEGVVAAPAEAEETKEETKEEEPAEETKEETPAEEVKEETKEEVPVEEPKEEEKKEEVSA